jgi:dsRNA-specific ribonuclease
LPNGTALAAHSKIISDLVEAYIGGLFLDKSQGPNVVREWLTSLLTPDLTGIERELKAPVFRDAKQELYGRIGSAKWPIEYVTVVQGSSTEPYTVEARIRGEVLGRGTDKNAKTAGLRAAMVALDNQQLLDKYERLRREGWHDREPEKRLPEGAAKERAALATATTENAKNILYGLIGSEDTKPVYSSVEISSSHDANAIRFKTAVYFQGKLLAEGLGTTKKLSEGAAALNALAKLMQHP